MSELKGLSCYMNSRLYFFIKHYITLDIYFDNYFNVVKFFLSQILYFCEMHYLNELFEFQQYKEIKICRMLQ